MSLVRLQQIELDWQDADDEDLPVTQQQGWTPPARARNAASPLAWQHSWPALVTVEGTAIVGFVRGQTDRVITTFFAEIAIDRKQRGRGIGRALSTCCVWADASRKTRASTSEPATFLAYFQGMTRRSLVHSQNEFSPAPVFFDG